MSIQTLIVDDEPLARDRVRQLLHTDPEFQVAGECRNGAEAVEAIRKARPDLIFLDVQMPEVDGFGVIEAIGARNMPAVIFVTAYDKYALRAFDENALDYLLKPYDERRFQRAVQRVKDHLHRGNSGDVAQRMLAMLQDVSPERKAMDRLVIKSDGRVVFLKTREVDYAEAAGNYLSLHVGKDTYLIRETMNAFEARLDPEKFLRIHRSTIVNIERIKEVQPWFKGEYVVTLRDGTELSLSRTYRDKLRQFLAQS
ncbi:MAG: LytR/AlgR family response regulator transcription factor [Terriglobales bacterium]|jgi:two-component system, LytTR family, response regulator